MCQRAREEEGEEAREREREKDRTGVGKSLSERRGEEEQNGVFGVASQVSNGQVMHSRKLENVCAKVSDERAVAVCHCHQTIMSK